MLLIMRTLHVFFADRVTALWAFLQVPIIAGLTFLAFSGFEQDEKSLDYFASFVSHAQAFGVEQEGTTKYVDKASAREIHRRTQLDQFHISAATSQRRASVYFLLVAASIWFGVMGACKEVVSEKDVLYREARSCFGIAPFLAAKFSVQAALTAIQTGMLALLIAFTLLDLDVKSASLLWFVLWSAALAAVCVGLFLSSFSPNIRFALTFVPLLMMPQFLLGGQLRSRPSATELEPPPIVVETSRARSADLSLWRTALSSIVIQRWGFEAALATDRRYARGGVLSLGFSWLTVDDNDARWRSDDLERTLRTTESSLVDNVFGPMRISLGLRTWTDGFVGLFGDERAQRMAMPISYLGCISAASLAASYLVMRIRFL